MEGLDNSIVNYDFWILKNKTIFFQNIYQKISFICDQLILHSNNSMFNFRISFIIKCSSYHSKFRKTAEYFSNPSYIFICGSLYVHVPGKWHFIVPSFFVIFSNKRNNNGQVFLKIVLIFSHNTWFCWRKTFWYIFFSVWVFFENDSRNTGEGRGHFFNSSLPLPPASRILRH